MTNNDKIADCLYNDDAPLAKCCFIWAIGGFVQRPMKWNAPSCLLSLDLCRLSDADVADICPVRKVHIRQKRKWKGQMATDEARVSIELETMLVIGGRKGKEPILHNTQSISFICVKAWGPVKSNLIFHRYLK